MHKNTDGIDYKPKIPPFMQPFMILGFGLLFIFAVIVLIMLFFRLMFTGSIFPPPNVSNIERTFRRDENELHIVANYLAIYGRWDTNITPTSSNIVIRDEEVTRAVNRLFRQRYQLIYRTGNVVVFQVWSNLDAGRGIAYSIDGITPGEVAFPFLTELEPLSRTGWYFYVDDFNEWRRRNRN